MVDKGAVHSDQGPRQAVGRQRQCLGRRPESRPEARGSERLGAEPSEGPPGQLSGERSVPGSAWRGPGRAPAHLCREDSTLSLSSGVRDTTTPSMLFVAFSATKPFSLEATARTYQDPSSWTGSGG